MANLPKGTTLNNTPIIVDSTKNDHRHNASSVIGLNEDVQGGGEIYAEFIDGVSYEQMQSTFVSENNNTMTGILSVTSGNNTNNIVSKSIVDNILISRGVKDYSLSTIPSTSETQAVNSIVHVGSSGSIDNSWLPGSSTNVNSNISISDVPSTVDSDTNYEFRITNFNAFSNYSVSVDIGNAGVYGDGILWYNTPDLSRSEQTVSLSIEKDGSQKEITFTLSQDLPLSLTLLIDGSFENVPDPLVIDSTDTVTLRIDSYKSGYNYIVTGDLLNHGFTYTINNNTIDIIPPSSLSTVTTSFSVSDGYDTTIINVEVVNTIYNSWAIGTLGGNNIDRYHDLTESQNGHYIAVGYTTGSASTDALIVDYDSNLNVIAQKRLSGSNEEDYSSVTQSHDGGFIVVGSHRSAPTEGDSDALIVKYDSSLNIVKQAGLGGTGSDAFNHVVQSDDGGYVAVGYQTSQGQSGRNAMIVKYDSNLNVITQKSLGGGSSDEFESLMRTSDGGYIAVGSQFSEGQGARDALIVKYDANLNIIKQAGLGGLAYDYYFGICERHGGGVMVVGYQESQNQQYDAIIVEYDSNLNLIKQKGLGFNNYDHLVSITQSDDGGYVAVGYQASQGQGSYDALIVKYDTNLNVITQCGLGTPYPDDLDAVISGSDGSYVAVGSKSLGSASNREALIIKLPNNLDVNGIITNHSDMVWTTPSLTEFTATLTETVPALVHETISLTETTPTLQAVTTTLVETHSEKQ